jgi:hypothetical protein
MTSKTAINDHSASQRMSYSITSSARSKAAKRAAADIEGHSATAKFGQP